MSGSHDQQAGPSSSGASSSTNATGRSGRQGANEFCSSCMTTTTPVWRRDGQGGLHCNACSLYIKTKGKPRPIHLESYTVKRRRARPTSRQVATAEGSVPVPNENSHRTISNPTPVAYHDATVSTRTEDAYQGGGARLAMSYPYRGHSAERHSRTIQNHDSRPSSTSLDLPLPPLPVLTTSTSMLETRTLPPLQQTNHPTSFYNKQRRGSR